MNAPVGVAKIRVVVVEDSLVQRAYLVMVLEADGDISVVAQATTAMEAIGLVAATRPDVVTLDLHLPDCSGNYVIEQVMATRPTPILVLSVTVGGPESTAAIEALERGALHALPKPQSWTADDEAALRRSVRMLSKATVIRHMRGRSKPAPKPVAKRSRTASPVVALAASTGGPAGLAVVLAGLLHLAAPVLVVQHLHTDFVDGLVTWMARVSALPVHLARHGQVALAGHVYIGPGDVHLRLGARCHIVLEPDPPAVHRPSADELFRSVAEHAGAAGVGVIMTGMGNDGAHGLLDLHAAGGRTFAQDEASCAVFGMPQAAYRLGAASDLIPLGEIAATVLRAIREMAPS